VGDAIEAHQGVGDESSEDEEASGLGTTNCGGGKG